MLKIASFQIIFVVKVFFIKSISQLMQRIHDKSGSHYFSFPLQGRRNFKNHVEAIFHHVGKVIMEKSGCLSHVGFCHFFSSFL